MFLKKLDTSEYNVTVISPRNFFLFTPLLPSVAVGTLATNSILQRRVSAYLLVKLFAHQQTKLFVISPATRIDKLLS